MHNLTWKRTVFPLLAGLLALACTACGERHSGPSIQSAPPPKKTLTQSEAGSNVAGLGWIPLDDVAGSLGLRIQDKDNRVQMGYTDVMFEVRPERKKAVSYGKKISLSDAPVRQNGKIYVTADALEELLQAEVDTDSKTGALKISSIGEKDQESGRVPNEKGTKRLRILSLPSNRDELVSYAKKFLGVPYEFGAAAYEQSKKFDCSSYTRHIFKHYGISLPRLARDQAKLGTSVKRDNLIAGDLVFFTVPGRFEDDKVPGHVGIYIGEGKFIHTWGAPGVQISPLDTGYWHNVLLSMRRVD